MESTLNDETMDNFTALCTAYGILVVLPAFFYKFMLFEFWVKDAAGTTNYAQIAEAGPPLSRALFHLLYRNMCVHNKVLHSVLTFWLLYSFIDVNYFEQNLIFIAVQGGKIETFWLIWHIEYDLAF